MVISVLKYASNDPKILVSFKLNVVKRQKIKLTEPLVDLLYKNKNFVWNDLATSFLFWMGFSKSHIKYRSGHASTAAALPCLPGPTKNRLNNLTTYTNGGRVLKLSPFFMPLQMLFIRFTHKCVVLSTIDAEGLIQ